MYSNIIIAIDLSSESNSIIKKALRLANKKADICVLHIMNPMDSALSIMPFGGPIIINSNEISAQVEHGKQIRLNTILEDCGLEETHGKILIGKAAKIIKQHAFDNLCDLIVIGTHGQQGAQLILGSTASSVLHGAPCDVLAIRNYRQ